MAYLRPGSGCGDIGKSSTCSEGQDMVREASKSSNLPDTSRSN